MPNLGMASMNGAPVPDSLRIQSRFRLLEVFMRTFRFAALALTLMLPAARSAWADGPTMNPGKWETKTVQTNSLSPKEHVKTITECVKENKNPLEAIAE